MSNGTFNSDAFSYLSRHIIAPLWAAYEHSPYLKHLKTLQQREFLSADEIRHTQWGRLKAMCDYAGSNSQYYKDLFNGEQISSWDDFHQLPILTKDAIRDKGREIQVEAYIGRRVRMKTSGSTGVSLELFMDVESQQWKRACALLRNMWSGYQLGDRVGAIWGNPEQYTNWRAWLRNFLLNRHLPLDTLHFTNENLEDYYQLLIRKRPTTLFGHAHSLYLFAKYCEQKGYEGVRPKGLISTAMVLHDFERETMERVFGCKVFDRYGCEEVSLIASECEAQEGLHVNTDTLVVEVVDSEGKPLPPGEPGAIVVTDLTNMAMPIIRYKIGDVGMWSGKPCSCGRGAPCLTSLGGRIADYVRLPDGGYVSGISLTENFHMALPGVKQLQIVQEKIDLLCFRVVAGDAWRDEDKADIARLVKERFGESMGHSVELVDSIQSDSSGKYRFCISQLEDEAF